MKLWFPVPREIDENAGIRNCMAQFFVEKISERIHECFKKFLKIKGRSNMSSYRKILSTHIFDTAFFAIATYPKSFQSTCTAFINNLQCRLIFRRIFLDLGFVCLQNQKYIIMIAKNNESRSLLPIMRLRSRSAKSCFRNSPSCRRGWDDALVHV